MNVLVKRRLARTFALLVTGALMARRGCRQRGDCGCRTS